MEITVAQIDSGVRRAVVAIASLEQTLNEADAKLGDGDTGSMLVRAIGAMAASDPGAATSVSDAFGRMARAAMSSTGSSLGTLFASALLSLSKDTKGQTSVSWGDLAGLIATARDGMMARGGAKLGDKTVLDGLDAIAEAIAGQADAGSVASAATRAVDEALAEFKEKPCRIGRAKFFPEKSVGLDDPGMFALVLLTRAVTQST
ncbi:MAG: dihydroxyacetone kinase subunit L [Alphaproteobacteria bacterium]|nr:MAG: dihydroxyacetone kinase subunit L [Alphaproteobacteria bacterium]